MPTTGNVFGFSGSTVDRAGATAWTNPTRVNVDDALGATAVTPTDYLIANSHAVNWSATLPATATILGVTVRVEASETGTGSSDYILQLISDPAAPTLIGSAKSPITITNGPTISTSGGPTDTWGAALTPAIVNATGFGVALWSTDTTNTLDIDFITIAVEYTARRLSALGCG